jgi:hypothetical protein
MMEHGRGRGPALAWHDGGRHGDDWWTGPAHFLVALAFVLLLVVAVVWLVRRVAPAAVAPAVTAPATAAAAAPPAVPPAPAAAPTDDPAVAALRLRYARGEVGREEFQLTLADLTGGTTAPTWPGPAPAEPPPAA